jgi:hypothetical protein
MTSWICKVVETGERRDALGQAPNGWLVFTPERMMIIVLKSGRERPVELLPTDAEKIALYDTMFAYSGPYTVHSDRVVHHLDMSWNEAWSGTDQVRFAVIDGDSLTYTSPAARNPLNGEEVVHEVTYKRAR